MKIGHRFHPVIQTLNDLIADQKYGELLMLEVYHEGASLKNNELSLDTTISKIDLANWFFREMPIVVFARMGNFNSEQNNFSCIIIGYKSNKTAIILSNELSLQNNCSLKAICSKEVIFSDIISNEISINGIIKKIPIKNDSTQKIQDFESNQEESKFDPKPVELENLVKIEEAALLSGRLGVPIYLDLK